MTKGYSTYRGRGAKRRALIVSVAAVLLVLAGLFVYAVWFMAPPPSDLVDSDPVVTPPSESPKLIVETPDVVSEQPTPTAMAAPELTRPEFIQAVYLPDLRDTQAVDGAKQLAAGGQINTVMINVKDDDGRLAFVSASELAAGAGANPDDGFDLAALLAEFNDAGLYVMARMAVFEENLVSNTFRDTSVATANGIRWLDWQYHGWLNPFSEDARVYIAGLCGELFELGIKEIVLDSFRFPTRGRPELLYFKDESEGGISRTDALAGFAAELATLADGFGARVTIAATEVDLTAPMYASGVSRGLFDAVHGVLADLPATAEYAADAKLLIRAALALPYTDVNAAGEVQGIQWYARATGGFVVESASGYYPNW